MHHAPGVHRRRRLTHRGHHIPRGMAQPGQGVAGEKRDQQGTGREVRKHSGFAFLILFVF